MEKNEEEEKARKEAEEAAKKKAAEEAANSSDEGTKGKSDPIAEARAVNEEKSKLLDREEALQAKKEKFHAEQMVGGHTQAGQAAAQPAKETDEEYTEKFQKGEVNVFNESKK